MDDPLAMLLAPRPPPANPEDIGGFLFVCDHFIVQQSLTRMIFGLPQNFTDWVTRIRPGLPLFVFESDTNVLHGIYEATCHGGVNIDPLFCPNPDNTGSLYPAQEETQRRVAAERAPIPGTLEEREVTSARQYEIYTEVAPVNSKGRVLGQGSLSQLYVRRGSRGDAGSSLDRIKDFEARLKEKDEEHAKFLEEQAKFQEEQNKFREEQAKFREEQVKYKEEQARKEEEQARQNAERDAEVKDLKEQLFGFMAAMKKMSPLFHGMSSESLP